MALPSLRQVAHPVRFAARRARECLERTRSLAIECRQLDESEITDTHPVIGLPLPMPRKQEEIGGESRRHTKDARVRGAVFTSDDPVDSGDLVEWFADWLPKVRAAIVGFRGQDTIMPENSGL